MKNGRGIVPGIIRGIVPGIAPGIVRELSLCLFSWASYILIGYFGQNVL